MHNGANIPALTMTQLRYNMETKAEGGTKFFSRENMKHCGDTMNGFKCVRVRTTSPEGRDSRTDLVGLGYAILRRRTGKFVCVVDPTTWKISPLAEVVEEHTTPRKLPKLLVTRVGRQVELTYPEGNKVLLKTEYVDADTAERSARYIAQTYKRQLDFAGYNIVHVRNIAKN